MRQTRSIPSLLALLAGLAALTLSVAPSVSFGQEGEATAAGDQAAPAAPQGVERFNGTWRYSGSRASGTRIIHRAVDQAAEHINFFIRAIAAGRLRDKNPLVTRIDVQASDSRIRITFDGSRVYDAPSGGTISASAPNGGDPIRVTNRYSNGSLVQIFRSDSGVRRNVYRYLPNGHMRMEVTVTADALGQPMRYRLDYRR